jgi:hypothetical protein
LPRLARDWSPRCPGHDDRRRGEADRRGPAALAVRQPRRHRDRHDGDRRPGIQFTLAEDLIEATSDTGHLGQAHEDLQRSPRARLGAALRAERDQPAADAAGVLDHAGMEPVITFALFGSIAMMERAVTSLRVNSGSS